MSDAIVFLDIDGVILPVSSLSGAAAPEVLKDPWRHIDLVVSRMSRASVARVQRFATEALCQLVLIST